MAHYLIFGDSITYGEGDPRGGWVQLLREFLTTEDCVFNLGVSGDTSDGVLARFETELKSRLSPTATNKIIFAIGINDSAMMPVEKYKENLIQLIKVARKYSQEIICIGPTPIDQTKVEVPWSPGKLLTAELVQQFNKTMILVAQQEKALFIDLFNYLKQDYLSHLPDGVHPDASGHQLIFDIINKYLTYGRKI